MSKLPSVINLHNEVFPKYKNINQDKSVVLIATGPSLKKFFPIDNAVYIGVNRAFEYEKVKFDYLFLQDYVGIQECMDSFMNYEPDYTTKFLGIISIYAFPYSIIPPRYGLYKNVERYYAAPPLEKENYTFDISSDYLGDSYFYCISGNAVYFMDAS